MAVCPRSQVRVVGQSLNSPVLCHQPLHHKSPTSLLSSPAPQTFLTYVICLRVSALDDLVIRRRMEYNETKMFVCQLGLHVNIPAYHRQDLTGFTRLIF